MIFRLVRDYDQEYDRTSLGWMKTLLVCRHWYTLGVEDPLLWTTVTLRGGQDCVDAMLARSRGALLDVYLDTIIRSGTDTQSCADTILKEVHRIRSLKMYHYLLPACWEPRPLTEAPKELKTLDLTVRNDFMGERSSDTKTFDVSSDWPFAGGLPSLDALTLTVGRSIHGVLRIPGLRSLYICLEQSRMSVESSGTYPAPTYNVRDLLASLSGMPLL